MSLLTFNVYHVFHLIQFGSDFPLFGLIIILNRDLESYYLPKRKKKKREKIKGVLKIMVVHNENIIFVFIMSGTGTRRS